MGDTYSVLEFVIGTICIEFVFLYQLGQVLVVKVVEVDFCSLRLNEVHHVPVSAPREQSVVTLIRMHILRVKFFKVFNCHN